MNYRKLKLLGSVGLVSFIVAACESPPPYVLTPGEFNRESKNFLDGVINPEEVTVCYAKDGTTARNVTQLAQNECALYGKKAVFRKQSYQACPLVTPIGAVYECLDNPSTFGFYKTAN